VKYPISQLDFDRDFASFVDLSHAIYGEKAVSDEAMYRWLFERNIYNPNGHLFHVAKDGDRVVASDCLMPIPLVIQGKKCLAAWSIKTMTHPDYQRQGIFRAMTEYNIARAKEAGIDLILGFANANSFPGYAKFGWDILVERRAIVRPLDIKRSLAKRKPLKLFAGIGNALYKTYDSRRIKALAAQAGMFSTEILTSAPDADTDVWPAMQAAFQVLVKRDNAYLDWRYNQRPRQDYKFILASRQGKAEAILIFRTSEANGSCIIIDYVGTPQSEALPALLYKTIQYCREEDLRYIINSSGSVFDKYLVNTSGFVPAGSTRTVALFLTWAGT